MQSQLEKILILQDRDLRLARMRKELAQLPREAALIESKLKTQSTDYEAHKSQAQHIEAHRQALDLEVKAREEKIKKYQNQQLQTKKNEEYQTLGNEIKNAKTEIKQLEDKELDLMEKYEEAKKALEAEEVNVREYETAASKRRDDLKKKEAKLSEESERLEKEVAELEEQVDKQSLRLYRRLIESKGDAAVVPVIGEGTCGGCHMKLTQQEVLEARRGTGIVQCSNCGRIIYWQNEFA